MEHDIHIDMMEWYLGDNPIADLEEGSLSQYIGCMRIMGKYEEITVPLRTIVLTGTFSLEV